MRKSVVIVVENLTVPFDRRVWMEALTLKNAGYDVSVICPVGKGYDSLFEISEGIYIYRHPMPPEKSSSIGYIREYVHALFWENRLIRKVWKERKFNIIHICNPPDLLFINTLAYKWFHNVKVVYDQHDLNPEMYETKFNKKDIFYYGLILAEFLTYKTANIVICTNESYKQIATGRGKRESKDVYIVRSGPDLTRFKGGKVSSEYRNNRRYLVGYVGVMGEQEGIDYLLRSIHYLIYKKQRKDIQFMIIGSGPAVTELKILTESLKIENFVEFTGRITDDDLLNRLSSCDICVNPDPITPFNDKSTMNKILEYMAVGKPIVQFDLTEGRRSAGNASLYANSNDEIDFAEKILELLGDEKKRKIMGEEGRKRMENELEWRYQIPKLLGAYLNLT